MSIHICTSTDFHPYQCHSDPCYHCDRASFPGHRPMKCALCRGDHLLTRGSVKQFLSYSVWLKWEKKNKRVV